MTSLRPSEHWPPEQVMLVLDILEDVHQAIWDAYENPPVAIIRRQLAAPATIEWLEQSKRAGQRTFDFSPDHAEDHDRDRARDLDDDVPF